MTAICKPEPATTAAELRDRMSEDGPIYASECATHTHTPMLTHDYDDGFQLVLENNDVGGGPAVNVTDAFALAWLAQFGDEIEDQDNPL